ncbi:hypothetical protein BcepSauron_428 [Burkholderia phage BcepSauron]|uniref:Uncharacterized protein n=2 Tax=Sarumanvirus TaxID=2843450 RepID=A0A482MMC6_9CAUD|nr:hypothetical protein H1O16_gp426 [Burkholderia phage BcepSaruman]YP_009904806.1 hypothetical protein H1O17_gp428 [Burkholderia phage BcepSauron]QBQ74808.1 hypothetical protein BcepSauron_428 [Burkholderia phage BcepSauron]QBX06839.1 hypothetical protein BcepSaruman_426 [Burkholderia phage BcepSaruman]
MDKRPIRSVAEREIAMALVLEFAESGLPRFALMGFYDDDSDFMNDLADRLSVRYDNAFVRKLTKVVRRLVRYGVLYSEMRGTQKYYVGEPAKQMEYWLRPGKASLLTRGRTEYTMEPEGEAAFLLRHAYPDPDWD